MLNLGRLVLPLIVVIMAFFVIGNSHNDSISNTHFSFISADIPTWTVLEVVFISVLSFLAFFTKVFVRQPMWQTVFAITAFYVFVRIGYAGIASYFPGETHFYEPLVQTVLFGVMVWLTARLVREVAAAENTLENVLIPGDLPIRSRPEALREVETRFYDCRRHGRSLGVLVLKPVNEPYGLENNQYIERIIRRAAKRALTLKIAGLIEQTLRRSDVLVEQSEKGFVVVVCPEADRKHLIELKNRLTCELKSYFDLEFEHGASLFPDEALTLEELVKRALGEIGHPPSVPASEQALGLQPARVKLAKQVN